MEAARGRSVLQYGGTQFASYELLVSGRKEVAAMAVQRNDRAFESLKISIGADCFPPKAAPDNTSISISKAQLPTCMECSTERSVRQSRRRPDDGSVPVIRFRLPLPCLCGSCVE